jgi:hypothetical protein
MRAEALDASLHPFAPDVPDIDSEATSLRE